MFIAEQWYPETFRSQCIGFGDQNYVPKLKKN